MNACVENTPPDLRTRLEEADMTSTGKLNKSGFESVVTALGLPPQDVMKMYRVAGYYKGNSNKNPHKTDLA